MNMDRALYIQHFFLASINLIYSLLINFKHRLCDYDDRKVAGYRNHSWDGPVPNNPPDYVQEKKELHKIHMLLINDIHIVCYKNFTWDKFETLDILWTRG